MKKEGVEGVEEMVLKRMIEKMPLSDALKNTIGVDKLHTIVSDGLVQLKNMGLDDKYPQIQDVVVIAGKFATRMSPLKLGGSDKQAVVLGLIDVLLEYIGSVQPVLKEKLNTVRKMAQETLPVVLALAVSGDLIRRKSGQSIGEYALSIGRRLLSFARQLKPSFLVCGLSTVVLDRAEEIVSPPKRDPVESDMICLDLVPSEKEQPHYTTPRGSLAEEGQTAQDDHQLSLESLTEETLDKIAPLPLSLQEEVHDKEHEIRLEMTGRSILYSA